MGRSEGYRSATRHKFSRAFRTKGHVKLSQYLVNYKLGDFVDVRANGAVHKGMPHKFYHGRTGRVWNVNPRGIGVEINKQVRQRIIKKRINVRVEHIQPSRCQESFKKRVKENEAKKKQAREQAKQTGKRVVLNLKRTPVLPRGAELIKKKFFSSFSTLFIMGNSQVYQPRLYEDKIEEFEARGGVRPKYHTSGPQPYYPSPMRNNRKGLAHEEPNYATHSRHAHAPQMMYAAPQYGAPAFAPPAYGYPYGY